MRIAKLKNCSLSWSKKGMLVLNIKISQDGDSSKEKMSQNVLLLEVSVEKIT